MRTITATELSAQLSTTETKPVLLDVREPHEFAYCRIEGSINIPMNSVPSRLAEIDPADAIITICHHGMRSAAVADFLLKRNYENVTNLEGGIEAWALSVEPGMPRY